MTTIKRPMPSHFGTKQPPPGVFAATCKIFGRGHNPVAFASEDRALFEAHMLEHRNTKSGLGVALTPEPKWAHKADWSPPKLTEDGEPFEPKDLQPGATVGWVDGLGYARTGQVWSAGYKAKSAWVIPFETLPNEAAVLLVLNRVNQLEHQDTFRRSTRAVS